MDHFGRRDKVEVPYPKPNLTKKLEIFGIPMIFPTFGIRPKKLSLKSISNLKSPTILWIKSSPNKFSLLHRDEAYLLIRLLIYGFKRSFGNKTD